MSKLGDYLFVVRTEAGLTIREVEQRSGVSNAYISQIESGKRTNPHPKILKQLAAAYGIQLEELMRIAGYLDTVSSSESEESKVERLYREALADPAFSFGRRSRTKVDFATKKLIAQMYEKIKEGKKPDE